MNRSGLLAVQLAVTITFGCRSPAEQARTEMQSVYRSAKVLNEQLKSGADLKADLRLRGNFATELGIVHDRMRTRPAIGKLLRDRYTAYDAALESYSLVLDILEYRETLDACFGPKPPMRTAAESKLLPLDQRIAELTATGEFFVRVQKCIRQNLDTDQSLHKRADQLGMNCPGFDSDFTCLTAFSAGKLATAEDLYLQR